MFEAITKTLRRPGSLPWLTAHSQSPRPVWAPLVMHSSRTVREYAPVSTGSHNYNESVVRIRRGEVHRGTVRSRLPLEHLIIAPGQASSAEIQDATEFVDAVTTICSPWVTAFLVPRLRATCINYQVAGETVEDTTPVQLAGTATQTTSGEPVVVMSMDRSLEQVRVTLHHEIWHQVEAVLTLEANRRLQACLSPYNLAPRNNDYARSPSERLARAYSHFAIQCDDLAAIGAPVPVMGSGDTKVLYDAFAEVYSGRFAQALA